MPKTEDYPLLMNYTGEIICVRKPYNFFYSEKVDSEFWCYPLGDPEIKTKVFNEEGALFPTYEYIVEGIPDPSRNTYYIVKEEVARLLTDSRNDLLIVSNPIRTSTLNVFNNKETKINGDRFYHCISTSLVKKTEYHSDNTVTYL